MTRPAHRPSRRLLILDAATIAFGTESYDAANLADIAQAAGVVPTAIYYHFGGKAELFNQTMQEAIRGYNEAVLDPRPADEPGPVEGLRRAMRASWEYWYSHRDAARLVARYLGSSAEPAADLRVGWEQWHLDRLHEYLVDGHLRRSPPKPRVDRAVHTIAVRAAMDITLTTLMSLLDGSFGRVSHTSVADAIVEMCVDILGATA